MVGTRYDPATTYKEAKRQVQQLGNARLLTMTGDGHTAYDGVPADGYNSQCADLAVEAYLFDAHAARRGHEVRPGRRAVPGRRRRSAELRSTAATRLVIKPRTRPLRMP